MATPRPPDGASLCPAVGLYFFVGPALAGGAAGGGPGARTNEEYG